MAAIQFSTVLKWVGYATAILSLIAGVRGLTGVINDRMEARRRVDALLVSARIQVQGHDYASAWKSLDQASKIKSDSREVLDAQENLAMAWLENIHVSGDEKF